MRESYTYTLMSKDHPVMDIAYDKRTHSCIKILSRHDMNRAPVQMLDNKGEVNKRLFNGWWENRAIPATRSQIDRLLHDLDLSSTLELAERAFGLSLTDHYWLNDPAAPLDWKDVNFFDNDFTDDLGTHTMPARMTLPVENPDFMSPCGTLNGDMKKKWVIEDGVRVLLKQDPTWSGMQARGEAAMTMLHDRLLEPEEHVSYEFRRVDALAVCACPDMVRGDEDFVPAAALIGRYKRPNHLGDYEHLVQVYEKLGIEDADMALSKMFVCDYILANRDRHYNNFGIMRDCETLQVTRVAPVFDSGSCLWGNVASVVSRPALATDFDYLAKPFRGGMKPEKQLELFGDLSWFDAAKLEGFTDELRELLCSAGMSERDVEVRADRVEANISQVCRRAAELDVSHVFVHEVVHEQDLTRQQGSPTAEQQMALGDA